MIGKFFKLKLILTRRFWARFKNLKFFKPFKDYFDTILILFIDKFRFSSSVSYSNCLGTIYLMLLLDKFKSLRLDANLILA